MHVCFKASLLPWHSDSWGGREQGADIYMGPFPVIREWSRVWTICSNSKAPDGILHPRALKSLMRLSVILRRKKKKEAWGVFYLAPRSVEDWRQRCCSLGKEIPRNNLRRGIKKPLSPLWRDDNLIKGFTPKGGNLHGDTPQAYTRDEALELTLQRCRNHIKWNFIWGSFSPSICKVLLLTTQTRQGSGSCHCHSV